MTAVLNILYRLLIAAVCLTASIKYIQWARADWLGSKITHEDLEAALRIEPDNTDFVRRVVSYRNGWADVDWVTDDELRRAARMDPLNAELWIPLAEREEARGDKGAAEADLIHAADVDHQFIPAWVLANYYLQTENPEKAWAALDRCLRLNLQNYSLTPVFALMWGLSSDAARIQSALPKQGSIPVAYLDYLITTDHADAAISAWPLALAAGAKDPASADRLNSFAGYLIRKGRTLEAVSAWNALIDSKVIRSGRLNPRLGESVADPDFRFTEHPGAFGWKISRTGGIFATALSSGNRPELSVDLDGNEPEAVDLASISAPVLGGRSYRLIVQFDPAGLKNLQDPGFAVRAEPKPGKTLFECPLLPLKGESAICPLTVPQGTNLLEIVLAYRRAPGTVRALGTLRLFRVALEFAD